MGVNMKDIENRFYKNILASKKTSQVTLIKDYSYRALRSLPLNSFDCVYIDGSHLAQDVISDLILIHPLIKKGGILICDDYDWEIYTDPLKKPKTAIDFFMKVYEEEYTALHKQQQVFLLKKQSIV
jgi:predicted O-methyltransferase YrrM